MIKAILRATNYGRSVFFEMRRDGKLTVSLVDEYTVPLARVVLPSDKQNDEAIAEAIDTLVESTTWPHWD